MPPACLPACLPAHQFDYALTYKKPELFLSGKLLLFDVVAAASASQVPLAIC
jgi:hypothetical protein